ncbi:hypothetical protein [Phosphitispora sp. TUW77]|uniref:hypothetical protein n=1 Tax=Phosphitispora sp. TUW77 TaxID=3152361 RepID=UPI003AB39B4A
MYSPINQIQSNLSQIAQICSQLSQSENVHANQLHQIEQSERTAAQQLQQAAQLCQQAINQVQSVMSSVQFSNLGQNYSYPYQSSFTSGTWANRPINTSQFGPTGQYVTTTY